MKFCYEINCINTTMLSHNVYWDVCLYFYTHSIMQNAGTELVITTTPTITHFVGGSIAEIISSTMVYTCTEFHTLRKKCTIACSFLPEFAPLIINLGKKFTSIKSYMVHISFVLMPIFLHKCIHTCMATSTQNTIKVYHFINHSSRV